MLRAGRALLVATTILTSPVLAQGPGSNFGGIIGGASLSDLGGYFGGSTTSRWGVPPEHSSGTTPGGLR